MYININRMTCNLFLSTLESGHSRHKIAISTDSSGSRQEARHISCFQTDDMRVDAKNQVSKLLRAQSPTSESPAQSYLSALERGEKAGSGGAACY
jgi:hypothetical protein